MECRVLSCGGAKGRHAKTRKRHHLAWRLFARRGERSPHGNPLNGDFGGFSRGDISPRQAKIRQEGGEKAMHEKCRTFVWRGERSPCENTQFGVFAWRLFAFSPRKHDNTKRHKSATLQNSLSLSTLTAYSNLNVVV